jgi:hypothetical protein
MSNRGFFVAWPVRASDTAGVPFRLLSDSVVLGGDVSGFVGVADLELLALPLEIVCQLTVRKPNCYTYGFIFGLGLAFSSSDAELSAPLSLDDPDKCFVII